MASVLPLSLLAALGLPSPLWLPRRSLTRASYAAHHCGPVGRSTPPRHRGSNHQRAQRRKARRAARVLRREQG